MHSLHCRHHMPVVCIWMCCIMWAAAHPPQHLPCFHHVWHNTIFRSAELTMHIADAAIMHACPHRLITSPAALTTQSACNKTVMCDWTQVLLLRPQKFHSRAQSAFIAIVRRIWTYRIVRRPIKMVIRTPAFSPRVSEVCMLAGMSVSASGTSKPSSPGWRPSP